MKVAITTSSFAKWDQRPLEMLKDAGIEVKMNPHGRKVTESELLELAQESVGLIAGTESLGQSVFSQLTELKVISRLGAGLSNVALSEAKDSGIEVFNTPDGPTQAVAELTIGLILDLLRKISNQYEELKSGIWKKQMGNLLFEKRVGIIGFGRIGQRVAQLLAAFSCTITYFDPFIESSPSISSYTSSSLEDLLAASDIIIIHCSGEKMLLDAEMFKHIRKGAFLLNMARGGIICENSLVKALGDGSIAGAALDVFETEPYNGELTTIKNALLTPHVGSYARESRVSMEIESVENLLKGLKN